MKTVKLFIILVLISATSIWAQNIRQSSMVADMVPHADKCTPLSQKEIEEINKNIQNILAENFAQKAGLPPEVQTVKPKNYDDYWATTIFTDNPELRTALMEKYKAYNDIRYGQNWKSSPYAKISAEEISNIINDNFQKARKALKQNPIYKSNRFGANCGQAGLIATDFAAFLALQEIALAALPELPAVTTVTRYSAISGLAWDFGPLFSTPAPLQGTNAIARIGGVSIGFGESMAVLDRFHSFINYLRGVPEQSQTSLGAQKDLQIALKHDFDLAEQIKEINENQDLNPTQKRKRIDTRYKEAIIKIYALDYVNTYLTYGEKPEKYLWALLDLTTLLQNRGTVTFEGDYGKTIEIETMPRLVERTPQMQDSLEKIMNSIINGFKIPGYGKWLQERVEKRALKNIEKSLQ